MRQFFRSFHLSPVQVFAPSLLRSCAPSAGAVGLIIPSLRGWESARQRGRYGVFITAKSRGFGRHREFDRCTVHDRGVGKPEFAMRFSVERDGVDVTIGG